MIFYVIDDFSDFVPVVIWKQATEEAIVSILMMGNATAGICIL